MQASCDNYVSGSESENNYGLNCLVVWSLMQASCDNYVSGSESENNYC